MFILTAIFHQSVHSTETRLPDGRAHTLSAVSRAVLVVLYHPWQPGQCTSSLLLLLFCYMTNEFFFFSYLKTSVSPCHVTAVVKVDRRIRWHTLLLYFAFALVHDSRGIEIVNLTISLALSAGTLMASAGTPYRLVPAHFYPCVTV